jgi:hypothetical protein
MSTTAIPAAPPYVAYSTCTETVIPADRWGAAYASLQALKGHVQEYPGLQHFDVFVGAESDGSVRVHVYTTWDTAVQRDVFLERGYTFERMLADVVEIPPHRTLVMEKVF